MVVVSQAHGVIRPQVLILPFVCVLLACCGCRERSPEVVVFTSQDRVYAEPIFAEFSRATGIKVRPLFDNEAAKTVGLASRLLAEKGHPQCDLFWNNEELRTWQLAARSVLETNWACLGFRSRQIVVNTNVAQLHGHPLSLQSLTESWCSGKVAIASPLFGTTATYFLALRQHWGEERWLAWCRAIAANKPFLLGGNSDVVNLVGRGEAWFGLTDSDDIFAQQREGLPIAARQPGDLPPMLIPNTLALAINRPHPEAAARLREFLLRPEIAAQLVAAHALDSTASVDSVADRLSVDYGRVVAELERATALLEKTFLK
jgi:iron(III) transport system substrate-binding protein